MGYELEAAPRAGDGLDSCWSFRWLLRQWETKSLGVKMVGSRRLLHPDRSGRDNASLPVAQVKFLDVTWPVSCLSRLTSSLPRLTMLAKLCREASCCGERCTLIGTYSLECKQTPCFQFLDPCLWSDTSVSRATSPHSKNSPSPMYHTALVVLSHISFHL